MAVAVVSTVIDASLDQVWQRMGDFANWHLWLPRITATTMDPGQESAAVGSVRTLQLADGSTVRERLLAKSDEDHTFAYGFDGPHPFPVRRYVGRVRMDPVTTSGATFVHWSGEFDCDADEESKALHVFTSIYTTFLTALVTDLTVQLRV